MERAGHQGSVTPRVPHPLEIAAATYTPTSEQPDAGKAPPQLLEQTKIQTPSGSDSPEIQHQQTCCSRFDGLGGEAKRVSRKVAGRTDAGVNDRATHAEVQAEDDPGGPDRVDDSLELGEGAERLETYHDLAGATGEKLQGPVR